MNRFSKVDVFVNSIDYMETNKCCIIALILAREIFTGNNMSSGERNISHYQPTI